MAVASGAVRRHPAAGVALVLVGIVSVQGGAAIAKLLFGVVDPAGMVWLRLVLAAIVLLAVARPRVRSWDAATWRAVVLFGVVLAAMNLLWYLAIDRIPLAVAVTCELLGPLVLALVLSRKGLDVLWTLVAVGGIALIGIRSFGGDLDPVGVGLALAAGACWAGYILCSQRVGALVPDLGGLAVAMAVGALAVLPVGVVPATAAVQVEPWLLLPVVGVALLSSVIPYGAENAALRSIPANAFGVLMALEPAAAALLGFVIAGERIEGLEWIAIVLVIVASAGMAITAARRRPRADTGAIHLQ